MADFVHPVFTALGGVSLWPEVPKFLSDMDKVLTFGGVSLLRWLFVFVLIMQGGAGMDVTTALVTTFLLFLLVTALNVLFPNGIFGKAKDTPAEPETPNGENVGKEEEEEGGEEEEGEVTKEPVKGAADMPDDKDGANGSEQEDAEELSESKKTK